MLSKSKITSLAGFGAALAALPLSAALAPHSAARSAGPLARLPVVARYQIGRFEVTVISDGYIDFPYDLFTGANCSADSRRLRRCLYEGTC